MDLNLGVAIKKLRTEKGMTQEELASQIGVSFQAVSKWETGATMPDISLLPGLAVFFGVRIDDLFQINHADELERIDHILAHEQLTDQNFLYAKRTLENLLRENANDTENSKRLVRLYLAKNHRDALYAGELLEKAMYSSPNDSELFTLYRRIHGGDCFITQSESEHFMRVCEPFANSQNPKLLELLIEAAIETHEYSKAEIWIENHFSAELRPVFLGDLELAKGNLETACELWDSIPKGCHKAQYEAGERWKRIHAYEKAIECFENAFCSALPPRDLSAVYSLAFLHTKLGNANKACEAWECIIKTLAADYNVHDGETIDWAKREIAKLKKQ